jgi:hypothetical protein
MKRVLAATAVAAAVGALSSAVSAPAQVPTPPSWPPGATQVFVWADTVTAATSSYGFVPAVVGKQENFFPQTAGVLFRAYAVDLKTGKQLTPTDVAYFYVSIPGQPNLKLSYGTQGTGSKAPALWTATWSIPPDYATGVVQFRILVTTKAKRRGVFIQVPVAASQLTVLPKP